MIKAFYAEFKDRLSFFNRKVINGGSRKLFQILFSAQRLDMMDFMS
tara:strand:- start:1645 stop:1782 length:138 start_codon:yes stop_codon:yes gene_type:complete